MPETIDVTGLPEPVVGDLRKLVATLRSKFEQERTSAHRTGDSSADEWIARFHAWAESHPKRVVMIDDSREAIYGGRGE